jgi:hypothetical protein
MILIVHYNNGKRLTVKVLGDIISLQASLTRGEIPPSVAYETTNSKQKLVKGTLVLIKDQISSILLVED